MYGHKRIELDFDKNHEISISKDNYSISLLCIEDEYNNITRVLYN